MADTTDAADAAPTGRRRLSQRGRRAALVVVMMLVAMAAVPIITHWWRPHYRPELQPGESYGIDVSHYQGSIDWQAVAADGIDFAYLKATEAGDWVDETFATNWDGARAAGLDVGAYHFFTFCRTGADQAANFLRVVPDDGDLPPAVDLEFPNNCSQRSSKDDLQRELKVFLDRVEEALGEPVLLYVEDDFDERYDIVDTFSGATWERNMWRRPGNDRWTFWQCSDVAQVDGIDGGVDLDVRRAEQP
jgi:lysozyme